MASLPPIFEHPAVKRARAFLASLLPAERAHLLFLTGALLIFCAGACAFSVPFDPPSIYSRTANVGTLNRIVLDLMAIYAFFVAGLGAFAMCFHGAERIVRRLLLLVVLPSAPGILAIIAERYLEQPRTHSVLEGPIERLTGFFPSFWEAIGYPSFGMCMWLVGLILLAVGVWRVMSGRNTLPVRFVPQAGEEPNESSASPDNSHLLKYFFALLLLSQLAQIAVGPLTDLFLPAKPSHIFLTKWGPVIHALESLLPSLVPVLCAIWLLRVPRHSVLPGALRRFGALDAAVAILLPAVVNFLPMFAEWGFQYVRWNMNRMAVDPPVWIAFDFSKLNPAYVALFLPAFAEELGWRCALQPVLAKRFGVRR